MYKNILWVKVYLPVKSVGVRAHKIHKYMSILYSFPLKETHPSYQVGVGVWRSNIVVFVTFKTRDQICNNRGDMVLSNHVITCIWQDYSGCPLTSCQ